MSSNIIQEQDVGMSVRLGWLLTGMAALLPSLALATAEDDYQALRPQLVARAGTPAYDAAFGIAALDSGRPVEAITAFERVLARDPGNHSIRTELARAYERVGDVAAAKREVDTVQASDEVPAPVRANLKRHASVLDETLTGGPITLSGYVHTTVGYDSNVNTASDSSYLLIPAFSFLGPARLDNGLAAEEDGFVEVENANILRIPYAPGAQFFISNRVNRRQMLHASLFNQMSASGELGWQMETPDDGWFSLGASLQHVWFAEEPFNFTYGFYGAWKRPLDESTALTLYGNWGRTTYKDQPDRDANRVVTGGTLEHVLRPDGWRPTMFAGAYGGFEETVNGSADFYSHKLLGGTAGIEAYPRPTTSLFAEASYEIRDYSDDYPLFLRSRFDRQLDLSAGVAQEVGWGFMLRPRVAWRNASSNVGFYDYQRWLGEVQVRYSF